MTAMTPFDGMNRMVAEMDEWMSGMRRDFGGRRPALAGSAGDDTMLAVGGDTTVTVERDEEGFVVYADLPGFETDDIDLRIDGRVLAIEATHETDNGATARSRHVSERFTLPEGDVALEEVTASYRNGVLEVHLPTHDPEELGRRIDID